MFKPILLFGVLLLPVVAQAQATSTTEEQPKLEPTWSGP
jgi:hypothetical protein